MYSTSPTTESALTLNHSILNGQLPQRIFARGEIIPPRNEVLWRIERGAVRTLTWSEDGTYITLGYWGPGDIIGYPLSRVKPYQIESLTRLEVSILPPHLWYEDVGALLSHIQQAEELLSIVHRKPISVRLWYFLLWLSEKFGIAVEQGKLLDLNITHQEIAEVLNTTRVTITRLLQQFEEEGKLLRQKRRMIICLPNKIIKE
ncbi:Crp/Fnr family transcriptional regulator [Tolypothrix sp. FACHB-123]|uniref:Crp/Fnr family transcriptional regulator n=1 Tax=Tolypothrix sp. FACHB-123 TaxID=2692868 RepID=UPI001688A413|nr:Crp/Fnr family transcriptional regulator [Tolypothrix sp. FACHB-123]MBD2353482.1 Crp/Fnr family transcriptional regulator [Tolypothrix sp. FACHB-123]